MKGARVRRVLFVNRFFWPDQSATSRVLTDLAFHIAALDEFEVHVVCSRHLYEDPAANLPAESNEAGVEVHRLWTTQFGRGNLFGRSTDYLTFYFSTLIWLLANCSYGDVVVAKTDPPLISVVAWFAARIKRATLVNWLQDLFPEVARALGVKLVQGAIFSLLFELRNKSLRAATVNVVIGKAMEARVNCLLAGRSSVETIENWVQGDAVTSVPHEYNELRKTWGLNPYFVIGYSGNLGRAHNYQTIVDAAEQLRDLSDLRFLIIGGGASVDKLKSELRTRNLGGFIFKPYQSEKRLSQSLSAADVHLVTLLSEAEGLIVPSKIYGILAAGRPVIFVGRIDQQLSNLISTHKCGAQVADWDQGRSLAQFLRDLYERRDMARAMGISSRKLFEENFASQYSLKKWEDLFRALS